MIHGEKLIHPEARRKEASRETAPPANILQ
jgi:hypothetical protein